MMKDVLKQNKFIRSLVALMLPFLASLIQYSIWWLLKPLTWILFYPAIFIAAWIGGLRLGLLATVVSAALGWYFFLPPEGLLQKDNPRLLVSTTIFISFGIFISVFRARVNKADLELHDKNESLQNAHRELERLYSKTKELDRIKSLFFANVSHELRTPLTLILGPLESLMNKISEKENKSSLEIIQRNARSLLKQVNDLLDISKLEAGKTEVNYTEANLAVFVKQMASNFSNLAIEKKIQFNIEVPDFLKAQFDADKMERVLMNLLSNAFKFTPEGGKVRIALREDMNLKKAIIEVADNGPGIPEQYFESVFERFFRIEDYQYSGTGLGLSIVKDFMELQKGQVQASKAPEGGALLTVTLPLWAAEGVTVTKRAAEKIQLKQEIPSLEHPKIKSDIVSPEIPTTEERLIKPLILIVEDNPDMLEYICQVLAEDFFIETAHNGAEGVEKAKQLRPNLIVSDIMMPVMSGDEMFKKVRSVRELESIPFIIISAKADADQRIELLRAGVQDYLIKPFLPEELRSKVKNLLSVIIAEAKYRALMESAQDAIIIVDSRGMIRFINNQTLKWFGYQKEELIGKEIELLIPERLRQVHKKNREQYNLHPEPRQLGTQLESYYARRKDGSEFPVSIALSPLHIDGLMVTAVVRDITEMKRLSEQALHAREEAISMVSHDLKNPLAAIRLSLDLLGKLPAEHHEKILMEITKTIKNAVESMGLMVEDLLDYSKMETGRLKVDKKPELLSDIMDEIMTIFGPITKEKSLGFKKAINENITSIPCERKRIIRVISNLLSNAVKFTPGGGTITITIEQKENNVLFAVADTGAGIASDQIPHVFERYWQAEETAKKGAGLGLAIAQGFVEAHGGKIWVESKAGLGSTFYFTLPL